MLKSPEKLVNLHIRVNEATIDKLAILAGNRNESLASTARRILTAGLDNEIAAQSLNTITAAVRSAIRVELKSTENRLAALGANASIAAGTTENMMFTLFKRNHGGDEAEKVRYAKEVHEEARKGAIKILKQREDDD